MNRQSNGLFAARAAFGFVALSMAVLLTWPAASAQSLPTLQGAQITDPVRLWPEYFVPGPEETGILYYDGSEVTHQTFESWRLICGSNPTGITNETLQTWVQRHYELAQNPVGETKDDGQRTPAITITYTWDGSVPQAARDALLVAKAYLETLFGDPITVGVTVSFQSMGPDVLGATSPAYVANVTYTNSRNGLVNGMDSDDTLQSWLPAGTSCPVRYNGGSGTITNESAVDWTRAAYRAAIGTSSGSCGSMTYNTDFPWDFDPTDGITAGTWSFIDVVVHETGHALGFVSGADGFTGVNFSCLDLFRFQRTDGAGDYNPDTVEEFQTTARLVDYNTPDDDHNSDLISVEYRMSDGDPWQASHWREQGGSSYIGLMDPAVGSGETYYPDYFTDADLAAFDFIGYDFPPCVVPQFTQQPPSQQFACVGDTVYMQVAVNIPNPGYQWKKGATNLVDDGVHIIGAQTATLTIQNVVLGDYGYDYVCEVTNLSDPNPYCIVQSNPAGLVVNTPVTITTHPTNKTPFEGAFVSLTVAANGSAPLSYQWLYYGVPVTGDNIGGATSPTLSFFGIYCSQSGDYTCAVSNMCGEVVSNVAHIAVRSGVGAGWGDLNCDDEVDFGDINAFVKAIASGEEGYYNAYPDCHWYNADINTNGQVGFDDINPFVKCLTTGTCP